MSAETRSRSARVFTSGPGRSAASRHLDRHAVLQRAQLLELLAHLEHPGRQLRELEQRTDPIGIDADVAPRAAEVLLAAQAHPGRRRGSRGSARG